MNKQSVSMTRRKLLEQAFAAHGIMDVIRLESHIRGCDLSRSVETIALSPGNRIEVWVRNGGLPGNTPRQLARTRDSLGL